MKVIKIFVFFSFILIGLTAQAESQSSKSPVSLTGMEDMVTNVANTAGRAVVSISTEHTTLIKGNRRFYFAQSPFAEDEAFRKFFDDFFGQPDREFKQVGLG